MQTPESSPDRRKSPLSSLTQKSWRNLRSKMQVLSPSPRDESRGQFLVLSSSRNASRERPPPASPPLIVVASTDEATAHDERDADGSPAPPLPAMPPLPKLSESLIPRNEPLNKSGPQTLGEPFDEDAGAFASDSDRDSAFSFNRQVSCKYYKDAADVDTGLASARSPCGSLGSYASYNSYGSYGSFASEGSYVSSSDLFYGGGMESEDPWTEDLSHLEEPDCLAALIAEANEIPFDEELDAMEQFSGADARVRRAKSAPSSSGASMHRQLSFSSNASASSILSDQRLKRARSTISTTSSVWPIME